MDPISSCLPGRSGIETRPHISVVVVSYNMRREIPRTLYSLSAAYQKNISRTDYEILLVDNGSNQPWTRQDLLDIDAEIEILNIENATPSPVPAANRGIWHARGVLIGVLIDGARLVTPGLLHACRQAARVHPRPIVATVGFHLGFEHQAKGVQRGYNQDVENRLLDSIGWPSDGYRLFETSVFNGSCANGWFLPMAETNALFMPEELWKELGGYDEAFQSPGGGLSNLDMFERALALPDTQLVTVLGEGNFHQVHGGISSNSPTSHWEEWHQEYRRIRNRDYRQPVAHSVFFGSMPPSGLAHAEASVRAARGGCSRDAASDYIELLEAVLLNETNLEPEAAFLEARDAARGTVALDERDLSDIPAGLGDLLAHLKQHRTEGRILDGDLSNVPQGYTMIGRKRMDNLRDCVEQTLQQAVPGDFVECGVWNGGGCILMRGILRARGVTNRKVWVVDSFCGLPAAGPHDEGLDLSRDRFPQLAISVERVKAHFDLFGLLDGQVEFLPGWFSDTLPRAPIERIAVLRLDGDLYSSTMEALTNLYDKVSPGGFIIIDDYGALPQCARAVEEFRAARGVTAPIDPIDATGVFWRKGF